MMSVHRREQNEMAGLLPPRPCPAGRARKSTSIDPETRNCGDANPSYKRRSSIGPILDDKAKAQLLQMTHMMMHNEGHSSGSDSGQPSPQDPARPRPVAVEEFLRRVGRDNGEQQQQLQAPLLNSPPLSRGPSGRSLPGALDRKRSPSPNRIIQVGPVALGSRKPSDPNTGLNQSVMVRRNSESSIRLQEAASARCASPDREHAARAPAGHVPPARKRRSSMVELGGGAPPAGAARPPLVRGSTLPCEMERSASPAPIISVGGRQVASLMRRLSDPNLTAQPPVPFAACVERTGSSGSNRSCPSTARRNSLSVLDARDLPLQAAARAAGAHVPPTHRRRSSMVELPAVRPPASAAAVRGPLSRGDTFPPVQYRSSTPDPDRAATMRPEGWLGARRSSAPHVGLAAAAAAAAAALELGGAWSVEASLERRSSEASLRLAESLDAANRSVLLSCESPTLRQRRWRSSSLTMPPIEAIAAAREAAASGEAGLVVRVSGWVSRQRLDTVLLVFFCAFLLLAILLGGPDGGHTRRLPAA